LMSIRRTFSDVLISVIALSALLLMLVSVDPRIREQIGTTVSHPSTSTITSVTRQVRDVSNIAVTAAEDHSLANAPIVVFSLVAAVLVMFMLRT
jgi:hypothetical protein